MTKRITLQVCRDCVPAGSTAPQLDDNRGFCAGCGQFDGNRHVVTLNELCSERRYYVTNTGHEIHF